MKNKQKVMASLGLAFALTLGGAVVMNTNVEASAESNTLSFDFTQTTSFDELSMFSVGVDPWMASEDWMVHQKEMNEMFTLENGLKINTSLYDGDSVTDNIVYFRVNETMKYFEAEMTYNYDASRNGWAGFFMGNTDVNYKTCWPNNPSGIELFVQNNGLGTYSSNKLNGGSYTEDWDRKPASWGGGDHTLSLVVDENGIEFSADGAVVTVITTEQMKSTGYEMIDGNVGLMFTNAQFTIKSLSITELEAGEVVDPTPDPEPEVGEVYENNYDFTTATDFNAVNVFSAGIDPAGNDEALGYTSDSWVTYAREMSDLFTLDNGLRTNSSKFVGNDCTNNKIYVRYNVETMQYFKAELKYRFNSSDKYGWVGMFLGYTNYERQAGWGDSPYGVEFFTQNGGQGTYTSSKLNGSTYTESAGISGFAHVGEHKISIVADGAGIKFYVEDVLQITLTTEEMAAKGFALSEGSIGFWVSNADITVKSFKFTDLHTACVDEDTNHACDMCGGTVGTHEAAEGTHNCAYCGEKASECADNTNDHNCDVCGTALTTCADNDNNHNCDICGKALTTCVDEGKDHACDVCGGTVGTHEAAEGTHICGYCGVKASECVDVDNNNACDVCGSRMHECADDNKDHNCDKCGTALSTCADDNKDHNCDYCGKEMTKCADDNKDHKCDLCGTEMTKCADDNKDHNCDICGTEMTKCADENKDHNCDICGTEMTKCVDDNKDHNCDICGTGTSVCGDANKDHSCDVCGEKLSDCADTDNNHKCDVCAVKLSDCKDDDKNNSCDICGGFVDSYMVSYDFTTATDFNAVDMFSAGIDPHGESTELGYTQESWVTYAREMNQLFTLDGGLKVNASAYLNNDVSENNIYVRYNKQQYKYFKAEFTYSYDNADRKGWAGFILGYTNYARKARWGDSPYGIELFTQTNGLGTYSSGKLNNSGYTEGTMPAGWVSVGEHTLSVIVVKAGISFYVDGTLAITISEQDMAAKGYEITTASIGFMFTNANFTAKSFKVSPLNAIGEEYVAVEDMDVTAPAEVGQFEPLTVTATVWPENATVQDIKFELPEGATSANGKVYFAKPGTYTIKAISADNEAIAKEITVTVTANDKYFAYDTATGSNFDNYFVTSGGSKDGAPAAIADYWTFNEDGTMTFTEKKGSSVDDGYSLLYLKDVVSGLAVKSTSFEIVYMVKSTASAPNGWHGVAFAMTDKTSVPNQAGISAFIQEEATKATIWGGGQSVGGVGGPTETGSLYQRAAWNMIKVRVYGEGEQTIEIYVNDMATPALTVKGTYIPVEEVALFTTTTITIADMYYATLDSNGNAVEVVYPSSLTVEEVPTEVYVGDQIQIKATVGPDNAVDKTLVYTSSNALVATVNADGNVTFLSAGETTITVRCKYNPAIYEEFTITATEKEVLPTSVKFDATPSEAIVGGKYTLFVTVLPADATNYAVTFTSSNTDVATVDADGRLVYVGVGETTITVVCQADESIKASFTLTVKAAAQPDSSAPTTSDADTTSDVESTTDGGCMAVVGVSMVLPMLAAVAVVAMKKKED